MIHNHRELIVWQKAVDLVVIVYTLTEQYPKTEIYGLTAQMRRSAVSIPSNIAEGRRRGGKKEFRQFLMVAYGSGAELETQIEISKRLNYGACELFLKVEDLLTEVMKMLNSMIASMSDVPANKLRS